MPSKSAAERMRKYRQRMSEAKKEEAKERNKGQQKKSRSKWDVERRKHENDRSKERMKKWRVNRKVPKTPVLASESPNHSFGSVQSLGKAMKRAEKALPYSPRKKSAVVRKLSVKFGFYHAHKVIREKTPAELVKMVQDFYESDSVSRQFPGKKDCITVRHKGQKEKIQKKVLLTTVMEAFKQFKTENPAVKIGKSKFASLRPKHVLPVSDKDHNVCCCFYHENFQMMLDGIRKLKPQFPSPDELIKLVVCDWSLSCYFGECDDCSDVKQMLIDKGLYLTEEDDTTAVCKYQQWNRDSLKTETVSTLGDAMSELPGQMNAMKRHTYIAKTQLQQIHWLRLNLGSNEAVMQEDFSENFAIKQQDEIMSAHWNTHGVTLFTAVLNTVSGSKCYVVVSNELQHDKYAVAAFNRAILQHSSSSGVDIHKLHIFSDGAGSQFKNRFTLSGILKPGLMQQDLLEIDWSFFGTAHGKGPVDGVGGTVKRAVWRRILQKQVVLSSAEEFAEVAANACPNIEILFVSSNQVAEVRSELDSMWQADMPKNIADIRSFHFFRKASATELEMSVVSPFTGIPLQFVSVQIITSTTAEGSKSGKTPILITQEQYYAVDFIDRFYIGRALRQSKKKGYWYFKFLHQVFRDGKPHFIWPKKDDCDDVHETVIFYGPLTLEGCGEFTVPDLKLIQSCYSEIQQTA